MANKQLTCVRIVRVKRENYFRWKSAPTLVIRQWVKPKECQMIGWTSKKLRVLAGKPRNEAFIPAPQGHMIRIEA